MPEHFGSLDHNDDIERSIMTNKDGSVRNGTMKNTLIIGMVLIMWRSIRVSIETSPCNLKQTPEEAKNCDDVTTAKILENPNPHGALVRVYGVALKIDTGAKRTFITEHVFNSIIEKPQLSPVDANYIAADGHSLKCKGEVVMLVIFNDHVFEHKIIVGGVKYNLLRRTLFLKTGVRGPG
ncbi:unnamed protein product [Mytilus coruscus]|uniref:Peptidase A2 domain-containing protein n=1 Tax=Mytilus coruscus TaxID=42192 RepID=A0A6J8E7F2_MYTCO|nr:unnamed protein product [Mytilus coruscus]